MKPAIAHPLPLWDIRAAHFTHVVLKEECFWIYKKAQVRAGGRRGS